MPARLTDLRPASMIPEGTFPIRTNGNETNAESLKQRPVPEDREHRLARAPWHHPQQHPAGQIAQRSISVERRHAMEQIGLRPQQLQRTLVTGQVARHEQAVTGIGTCRRNRARQGWWLE